ncbi:hypothetical protein [Polaromonas sp.]|uniref:hypothetical protein n=1 Tax=Polaromonas sp. TaxID=1869339 RepID=UPI00286CA072|nr:hypothetical protein [Polaromonas sp.]
MQARFKHTIARYSQGERRRARFEQARLIALHARGGGKGRAPRLRLAARIVLWLNGCGVLICLVLLALVLSACAAIPGVAITDDERAACEASGCTVWTQRELEGLARKFFQQGYDAGVKSI